MHIHQGLAGLGVDLAQHLGGDLHQEAVEVSCIPFGEDVGDLAGVSPRRREATG